MIDSFIFIWVIVGLGCAVLSYGLCLAFLLAHEESKNLSEDVVLTNYTVAGFAGLLTLFVPVAVFVWYMVSDRARYGLRFY